MKIQETVERDCCQRQDLKPLHSSPRIGNNYEYMFCIHCGRYHAYKFYNDGVDSNSRAYMPLLLPWESR